jgi:hypothetical protein
MKSYITFFLCLIGLNLVAQNNSYDCSKEPNDFDFWLGNWQLTWNDTVHGTNKIFRENSCVIHENFISGARDYLGQSFTVYDPKKEKWKQTWVDNQNAYLLFTGQLVNGEMILTCDNPVTSDKKRQRFTNIHRDNFEWHWESSSDNGVTWKPVWVIYYSRTNKE